MEQTNRRKTGQANNVKYGLLVEQRLRPYCEQPSSFICQLHAPQTCLYTLYISCSIMSEAQRFVHSTSTEPI